jgi:hypothetical protein
MKAKYYIPMWILILLSFTLAEADTGICRVLQSSASEVGQGKIKRIINEQGWKIPGLAQSQIVAPRGLVFIQDEKSLDVYSTWYKPKREVTTEIPSYWLTDDGEVLKTRTQTVAIQEIMRYDIEGRIFSYMVVGTAKFYDQKTGHGGYGGQFTLYYYDDDGDGRIETYEPGGIPYKPRLPKWVKVELKQKK